VGADVLSITSWSELARDGMAQAQTWIGQLLAQTQGPVIAASIQEAALQRLAASH